MNVKINNTSANLETLTYAQLKAMVPVVEDKLPTYKQLMGMNPETLFTAEDGGMEITVYTNGCYTAAKGDSVTVYSVDRCRKITYHFDGGETMDVPESEYADGTWWMPLMLVADYRLEDSAEHRESYQVGFNYTFDEGNADWVKELSVPDFATQMEEQEKEEVLEMLHQKRLGLLEGALADLTEKQFSVVKLYFMENQTQQQIASQLGVNRKAVAQMLQRAAARMKKYFEKNLV